MLRASFLSPFLFVALLFLTPVFLVPLTAPVNASQPVDSAPLPSACPLVVSPLARSPLQAAGNALRAAQLAQRKDVEAELAAELAKAAQEVPSPGCDLPEVGQSWKVDGNVGTEVRTGYALTRLPDETVHGVKRQVLRATFNFKFTQANGTPLSAPEQIELQRRWAKRTNDCFQEVKPLLVSPDDHERLELLVASDTPDATEVPAREIKLVPSSRRTNYEEWADDSDCATIVHETFHHAGLVDEYKEKINSLKFVDEQGGEHNGSSTACRAFGPLNSFMTKAHTVWTLMGLGWQGWGATPPRPNLLFRGQFRMITHPGCEKLNHNYLVCAKNAYRTTRDMGGAGCAPMPAICDTPWWMD